MSSFELTKKKLVEKSVIAWKIPDITKLHNTKGPDNERETIEFSAGESLDLPSTWSLQLCFTTGKDIELYLFLEESPESVKSIYASYTATVNYPNSDEEFKSQTADKKEYTMVGDGGFGWGEDFVTLDELKAAGILNGVNDTLTIHVKLEIYAEEMSTPVCSQEMLKENAVNLMSIHFLEVLKSGESSDFVIRVKDVDSEEYMEKKVHGVILSAQSPVFQAMLRSQMSEKETGIVTIEDLSPKGLDVLLEFVYTGNAPNDWKLVPEEILNAAEKYQLPLLKNYIGERLHEACTTENAVSLFNLANGHGLPDASKNILKYIKSNLENVLKKI